MSLARRLTLLITAVLLLALAGGLLIHGRATRDLLQSQLATRNRDAAASLALVLTQQRGDAASMQALAQAQFDLGHYRRISLLAADGQAQIDLRRPADDGRAPNWFVSMLPLTVLPGQALVGDGWRSLGSLRVESRTEAAQDALWDASRHSALLLAALAAVAAALVFAALRLWLRPLASAMAQAEALAQGRFVEAEEPSLPELRGLTRSMNRLVQRMREVFAAQAEQVALLQNQAQLDAVTGLPRRPYFLGQLQHRLGEPGGPGVALILVRVLELQALNPRLGHDSTDRLLGAVADVLLTYVDRVSGTFAGRLNGADFALCLPVSGVAHETASSLRTALAAAPALRAGNAEVVVGAADGLRDIAPGAALAAADAALAFAEASADAAAGGPTPPPDSLVADPAGARAWREQIAAALAEERTRIAEFRVVDRDGRLMHLECPLRVQLHPGGDYQAAARWLALAHRSRLLPQVDLAALTLALRAIATDGQARSVHASLHSLTEPGFVAEVAQRLRAQPDAARRLSIECVEGLRPAEFAPLAEASAAWRSLGVRIGVEHAGASPQQLPGLHEAGIDYVKVDARHLRGAAGDAAVRGYAQSLVALIHGLGLEALAEGIDDAADLKALWALGFDGATGPAVNTG